MKVETFAPNHTVITNNGKRFFSSYNSVIVCIDENGTMTMDKNKWNFSTTTAKYRNQFTGLTTKETEKQIKDCLIVLVDLNS
jgi:hypothetical protein